MKDLANERFGFDEDGVSLGDVSQTGALAGRGPLGLLQQLRGDGRINDDGLGEHLPWLAVYDLLDTEDAAVVKDAFGLPDKLPIAPRLRSHGSLTSADFAIGIDGWQRTDTHRLLQSVTPVGAIAHVHDERALLPRSTFELLLALKAFARREARDASSNRTHWAHIRQLAINAGANLDAFLYSSIVISPDTLELRLQSNEAAGASVVTVEPLFAGAPDNWLEHFDRFSDVRPLYNIPSRDGIIHVEVKPAVQRALRMVKQMPGRRVAGSVAERFVANPFALLGPTAADVLDSQQIEAARRDAGIVLADFSIDVKRGAFGDISSVDVLISVQENSESRDVIEPLKTLTEAGSLVNGLRTHLDASVGAYSWRKHFLAITDDCRQQLQRLEDAIRTWQTAITIRYAEITDLSRYSSRISGIGEYVAPTSDAIRPARSGDPWLPAGDQTKASEAALAVQVPAPDGRIVEQLLTPAIAQQIDALVSTAGESGTIHWPMSDHLVSVTAATEVLARAKAIWDFASQPGASPSIAPLRRPNLRKELLLRQNLDSTEYEESRNQISAFLETPAPRLPRSIRAGVELLAHQQQGVARMQYLLDRSPENCRGVILADEMGLGKTLQILTLIARHIEEGKDAQPAMIVAPVSLLENWQLEINRFFADEAFAVLTLYGTSLSRLREDKGKIDQQLLSEGFSRFLKPQWIGQSNLVLTTYETMRDLEFSLAEIDWSIVVCDEAQKIKNPDALVTRAAKKLKARFRIACSGTPVENTLQDLWCLFDFIQPGLLGSRAAFAKVYRKPIECETEEQLQRIDQLRALIEPQIIRRTKKEAAKELPAKSVDPGSLTLPISSTQRRMYAQEREAGFGRKDGEVVPRRTAFQILPRLRQICSDPREHSERSVLPRLDNYLHDSPKLVWLIATLKQIRTKNEKALIFCELRDLQRVLVYAIFEKLKYTCDVINGDTEVSLASSTSRQKRLQQFQAKPGFGAIILSPLAVGFGVNIQAANHVIHFVRLWNPAKEDQATDRAYRIGQTKPVTVYYPTITADFKTFDMKLHEVLEWKRGLSGDMLNGTPEAEAQDFADVLNLSANAFNRHLNVDDLGQLSGSDFERFITVLWTKRGFRVTRTGASNDRGVDVVAIKGDSGQIIQCKSSPSGKALGSDGIKDVVAGEPFYRFKYPGIALQKVCVGNQPFNATARETAAHNKVVLIDINELGTYLRDTPVAASDLGLVS